MVAAQLLTAIRQHQQRLGLENAAGQMLDEIERRLIRPVKVFDDQDTWRGTQLLQYRSEERRTLRIALERGPNRGGRW